MSDAGPSPLASSSAGDGGPPASSGAPPVVAGYDLCRILGRGGMGIVWEAREHRLDRIVALKVSSGEVTPSRVARLWSEACLAAKIGHPGIVPVHDFGYSVDGRPYYTMELVEGTELRALLNEGPLPVPRAIELGLQIADAVAAAHDRGILHRDLKPTNVLLDAGGRVKILDFGLAVRDDDPRKQDPKRITGSPPYMAPERFQEKRSIAASDVFSLGVCLYEMLVGDRPFRGSTPFELCIAISTLEPTPPSGRRPGIHPDLERIVMRCLAKDPQERWPTARGLAEALRALVEGRPLEPARIPAPASRREAKPAPRYDRRSGKTYVEVTLDLRASPETLWPHVANTDRFNRAAGLGEVAFTAAPEEGGGSTTTGAFRTLGMEIAWEEHPFEWVKDREHSVYREYSSGPLKALWNHVRLTPREGGGTRLVHEVRAIPSGVVGRLAAQFELQMKLTRRFEEVYRRLDAALAEGAAFTGDPFEGLHVPGAELAALLHDASERLVDRQGFGQGLVSHLRDMLLYAPDKRLERLRPWALADAWREDRAAVLDMMLVATSTGLLQLSWDVLCPRCQVSHEVAPALARITPRGVCAACNASYEVDLASTVELIFRPRAGVRACDTATYCVGAPARRPHVVAQQVLAPGEERTITVSLERGEYRVAGPRIEKPRELAASPIGWAAETEIVVAADGVDVRPGVVRAAEVTLRLTNATDHDQIIRLESTAPREDAVTAATALAHPRFRELFSNELLAYGQHVSVSRAAFLFLDVPGRFDLLELEGDAGALAFAAQFEGLVAEHASARGGSVVESGSDLRQVLTFPSAAAALDVALAIQAGAEELALDYRPRAAVHEGPCIALTRAGRVEWFGDTVTRGSALLEEVGEGGIALSYRVADDRDVVAITHACGRPLQVAEGKSTGYYGRRVVRLPGPVG